MGMFSEIATEGTIQDVLRQIDKHLDNETDLSVRRALRAVARDVLANCFDWDQPEWARTLSKTKYAG